MGGLILRLNRGNKMTTNVPTAKTLTGFWETINVDVSAYTAPLVIPSYRIWSTPDLSKNIVIEEKKVESKEKLQQLFLEFAQEDLELAEMGLAEYNEILLTEDVE